ncbi:MAG TPA: response regulator [Caulobacterales bacterium]|nr:response regulator [Caulobacterales bacterium]
MNGANLPAHLRINLEASTILFIDDNAMSLEILGSVFYGFGCKDRVKCANLEDAKNILLSRRVDLIFLDAGFPDDGWYKFMQWLRRDTADPMCFTPVIIISGHSTRALVRKARDCGAHFTVAKPITTGVLLNRLAWIAHEQRPFVRNAIFAGPDRRWKNNGAPPGTAGRRSGDAQEDNTEEPARASA